MLKYGGGDGCVLKGMLRSVEITGHLTEQGFELCGLRKFIATFFLAGINSPFNTRNSKCKEKTLCYSFSLIFISLLPIEIAAAHSHIRSF